MGQLHLIQSSLSGDEFLEQFEFYAQDGDSVLFLNDSVFSLIERQLQSAIERRQLTEISFKVLKEQVDARAIEQSVSKMIERIRYPDFVELSLSASKVVSW